MLVVVVLVCCGAPLPRPRDPAARRGSAP